MKNGGKNKSVAFIIFGQCILYIYRAGNVTFKMYFTTDYKILGLKSNQ